MKWVTRDHVHMDRVACAWLIRRRVDPDAEFLFVVANTAAVPKDAIPFGIPGHELAPAEKRGSTFRVIAAKYGLADPALHLLAEIVESGIRHVLGKRDRARVAELPFAEGVGLDALSEGMLYLADSDAENIENSLAIYDALYLVCRARTIGAANPEILKLPTPERWDALKKLAQATDTPLRRVSA